MISRLFDSFNVAKDKQQAFIVYICVERLDPLSYKDDKESESVERTSKDVKLKKKHTKSSLKTRRTNIKLDPNALIKEEKVEVKVLNITVSLYNT